MQKKINNIESRGGWLHGLTASISNNSSKFISKLPTSSVPGERQRSSTQTSTRTGMPSDKRISSTSLHKQLNQKSANSFNQIKRYNYVNHHHYHPLQIRTESASDQKKHLSQQNRKKHTLIFSPKSSSSLTSAVKQSTKVIPYLNLSERIKNNKLQPKDQQHKSFIDQQQQKKLQSRGENLQQEPVTRSYSLFSPRLMDKDKQLIQIKEQQNQGGINLSPENVNRSTGKFLIPSPKSQYKASTLFALKRDLDEKTLKIKELEGLIQQIDRKNHQSNNKLIVLEKIDARDSSFQINSSENQSHKSSIQAKIKRDLKLENINLRTKKVQGLFSRLQLKFSVYDQNLELMKRKSGLFSLKSEEKKIDGGSASIKRQSDEQNKEPQNTKNQQSNRSSKSDESPAGPRTPRITDQQLNQSTSSNYALPMTIDDSDDIKNGQILMIRAPSLVQALSVQQNSARTMRSEQSRGSSSQGGGSNSVKSQAILTRVVSSSVGSSSGGGSQGFNSARLLSNLISPRQDEFDNNPSSLGSSNNSNIPALKLCPKHLESGLQTLMQQRQTMHQDDEQNGKNFSFSHEMGNEEEAKRIQNQRSFDNFLGDDGQSRRTKQIDEYIQNKIQKLLREQKKIGDSVVVELQRNSKEKELLKVIDKKDNEITKCKQIIGNLMTKMELVVEQNNNFRKELEKLKVQVMAMKRKNSRNSGI